MYIGTIHTSRSPLSMLDKLFEHISQYTRISVYRHDYNQKLHFRILVVRGQATQCMVQERQRLIHKVSYIRTTY